MLLAPFLRVCVFENIAICRALVMFASNIKISVDKYACIIKREWFILYGIHGNQYLQLVVDAIFQVVY